MTDDLTCPTCWATDLDTDEMCSHRNPICVSCCLGGEHDWTTGSAA